MLRLAKYLSLVLMVLLSFCRQGAADELVIGRGKKLEGKITGFSNNEVNLKTETQEYSVNINIIQEIRTDSDDPKIQALVENMQKQINELNQKKLERQIAFKKNNERLRMEDLKNRIIERDLQEQSRKQNPPQEQPRKTSSRKNIHNKKVEVFILEGCPWCKKMEQMLAREKVKYKRYVIDKDDKAHQLYEAKGGDGSVPYVVINDSQVVSGYDPDTVMAILER